MGTRRTWGQLRSLSEKPFSFDGLTVGAQKQSEIEIRLHIRFIQIDHFAEGGLSSFTLTKTLIGIPKEAE